MFHKSKEEIKQIATDGAKLVKQLSEEYEGNFLFEYSPETVSYTHLDVYKRQLLDNAPCQAAVNLGSGALLLPINRALFVQRGPGRYAKGSPIMEERVEKKVKIFGTIKIMEWYKAEKTGIVPA